MLNGEVGGAVRRGGVFRGLKPLLLLLVVARAEARAYLGGEGGGDGEGEKQIPFGNDSKKGNSNDQYRDPSLRSG